MFKKDAPKSAEKPAPTFVPGITPVSPTPSQAPTAPKSNVQIISIPAKSASGSPVNGTTKDIDSRSKTFLPASKTLVDLLDATGVQILEQSARPKYGRDRAEVFGEACAMLPETKEAMSTSTARILARHVESDEAADIICITGGLASWGSTIMAALAELKKVDKK